MVKKSNFVKKKDNTIVRSNHPPLKTIIISYRGEDVNASPFERPNADSNANTFTETKKVIEQDKFVNNFFHFIGQQLERNGKKNLRILFLL